MGLDLIPLNFPLGCLGVGLDLIPLNFPLGCGPGPDPPQFPPLGVGLEGGGLLWGVSCLGGCLLLWVSALGGGIPACTEADTPPLLTESQTHVKTLPCPNFVAGGNYTKDQIHQILSPVTFNALYKKHQSIGLQNYVQHFTFHMSFVNLEFAGTHDHKLMLTDSSSSSDWFPLQIREKPEEFIMINQPFVKFPPDIFLKKSF